MRGTDFLVKQEIVLQITSGSVTTSLFKVKPFGFKSSCTFYYKCF